MILALAVLVAFVIDGVAGEPPARWHPVVWMGRALACTGAPWPAATPRGAFLRGAVTWTVGASVVAAGAWAADAALAAAARSAPVCQALLLGLALKPLLAWRLLYREVAAVESAVALGIDAGRARLRHLVSRDTGALTVTQVRESALESLAENLNDSFVAPLFWFAVGGLPAAAVYRFANTADAMWGYRGRWQWAGKCSARADDVLSYVPARLTALLLALAARRWPRGLRHEARKTPSPNGGWPMAMLALALDVRLSKPGVYALHDAGRAADGADVRRGLRLATQVAWWSVTASMAALLGLAALRA